jgi:hypothetical protein
MLEQETAVPQAASIPTPALLFPMPTASPELVARWLNRLRIGATFGVAVVLCCVVYGTLLLLGRSPGPRLDDFFAFIFTAFSGIVAWLLISPEPGNPGWLRRSRFILRLAVVIWVAMSGVATVFPGFFARLIAQMALNGMLLLMACDIGAWFLFYRYRRKLARRIGDKTLNSSLTLLVVLCAAVFIVFSLMTIASVAVDIIGYTFLPGGPRPDLVSSTPNETQNGVGTNGIVRFLQGMAYLAWNGWIMLRLSRRFKGLAGRLRRFVATDPVAGEPPI